MMELKEGKAKYKCGDCVRLETGQIGVIAELQKFIYEGQPVQVRINYYENGNYFYCWQDERSLELMDVEDYKLELSFKTLQDGVFHEQ